MRRVIPLLAICGFTILLAATPQADAQKKKEKGKFDPPESLQPTPDQLKQIEAKTAQLAAKIAELRKDKKTHELLPDVEIYLRGARNIVRFKEFFSKDSVKWTLAALATGLLRAEQLAKGETPWTTLEKRNVLRAYRSVIDGTAQAYGVTYPLDYGKDPKRKWRVDIVLHGRGGTLTEVSFANTHSGSKKVSPDQDWVQIDIYGRGNNAYRWSGETDVLEAMEAFFRAESRAGRDHPDRRRVVLRGFSMGGAGTWHLGLHYPDKWCVMGPGAGFTTTHDYAWKGKKELPDYQERCLRVYDAIDYVENARMIPIVAYSGGDDAQKLAADNIENRLKELKINAMTHLVKPGVGHKFDADYFQKANALWSEHATKGRPVWNEKTSFVTYTTKYPMNGSVWIVGLEKHYEKASVEFSWKIGENIRLTTRNVRELMIPGPTNAAARIEIDGVSFPSTDSRDPLGFFLVKEAGKWKSMSSLRALIGTNVASKKLPYRQGPIDDAFASGFMCVLGTGETWHPATQKFVDAKVKAFEYDWAKH